MTRSAGNFLATARGGLAFRPHAARGLILALALVAATLLADAASACTVCLGAQTEASRKAFVGTTAFLTFLPLTVVGGVIALFVRRTLAQEALDESSRVEDPNASVEFRG
ncbi:MAG: hypothetical protein OSB70_08565 [Myxococcota bacterium]|jgi:hypothetical protein|nr:hypothetical protein [Myxococcota bacterium]